jgi:hypothetical protein
MKLLTKAMMNKEMQGEGFACEQQAKLSLFLFYA